MLTYDSEKGPADNRDGMFAAIKAFNANTPVLKGDGGTEIPNP